MSLQAILDDVESCIRASASHNGGTPEENDAVLALQGLAGLLAARVRADRPLAPPAPPAEKSGSSPRIYVGLPHVMIERLGELPSVPVITLEVKDLSSQVKQATVLRSRVAGDYDPDYPPPVSATPEPAEE